MASGYSAEALQNVMYGYKATQWFLPVKTYISHALRVEYLHLAAVRPAGDVLAYGLHQRLSYGSLTTSAKMLSSHFSTALSQPWTAGATP